MNGLEKIIEQINSDGNARCAQIISSANAQAEQIKQSIINKAESDAQQVLAAAEEKSKKINEISAVKCQQIKKQQILSSKIDLINNVINDASIKLDSLPTTDYFDFLVKLVSKYSRPGKCELLLNAKDNSRVDESFYNLCKEAASKNGSELTVSSESADIKNGLILRYGLIEMNCSFDALINENREEIKEKVNAILFQGA